MKKDIHPALHRVIFRDRSTKTDFYATSTVTSDTTEEKDGVTYYVIPVEISSASHPFYTGKEHIIDAEKRVDTFKKRVARAASATRAPKKQRKTNARKVL